MFYVLSESEAVKKRKSSQDNFFRLQLQEFSSQKLLLSGLGGESRQSF